MFKIKFLKFNYQKLINNYSTKNVNTKKGKRYNAIGIQMLSQNIHKQIFGECEYTSNSQIKDIKTHLKQHSLLGKTSSDVEDVDFKLPRLFGNNIEEHFQHIAEEQTKPYIQQAQV